MKREKFTFSEGFIKVLIEASGGFLSPAQFDDLVNRLEDTANNNYLFTATSEANLIRIINGVFEKHTFLTDLLKFPHHVEVIIAVAANSNYLTDIVVSSPEYLYLLFNEERLGEKLEFDKACEVVKNDLSNYKSFNAKLNYIRHYKKRHTLRIGLNDILGRWDLKTSTYQLSVLAKVIISEMFEVCHTEVAAKYNHTFEQKRYAITALGKLGGNELNYSSDVDLMVLYDKNTQEPTTPKREYHELLSETVQLFAQKATEVTEAGYVFRVDFRLRPDGQQSPLCRTLTDYIKYYEVRGEEWERQMLIKASYSGGNIELHNKFDEFLQRYIFPSSLTAPPFEVIRKMKRDIEHRIGGRQDIKQFKGGIRDIEFSVQALQLLNGGRVKQLRTGNTLTAIDVMKEKGFLTESEAATFLIAYDFYRRVEHFLQLMNDTQTHTVPSSGETAEKLSAYLGFDNLKTFTAHVNKLRGEVRAVFTDIVGNDNDTGTETNEFNEIDFANKERAKKNLLYLQMGMGLLHKKEYDAKTIAVFKDIEPDLLEVLNHSHNPDLILDNFAKVISALHLPGVWYSEFKDAQFFDSFLKLCEYSQRAIDLLCLDKSLAERFITRKAFAKISDEEFGTLTTNQILFSLAVKFTLHLFDHEKFSELLCRYVAKRLRMISREADLPYNYFIAGLGSFAAGEMSFSSDIDLVVVVDAIEGKPDIQKDFQAYLNEAQRLLKPFEVDFRLRPEGQSSPLVWDIESYDTYLRKRARVWELQSLTKLKYVAGSETLHGHFCKIIETNVDAYGSDKIKSEMKTMFNQTVEMNRPGFTKVFNIKRGRGGLINIDYLLQYAALLKPESLSGLYTKPPIIKLGYFAGNGIVEDDADVLAENYHFFKKLELAVQNIFNQRNSQIPNDDAKRRTVALFLGYPDADGLEKDLADAIQTNSRILTAYLNEN